MITNRNLIRIVALTLPLVFVGTAQRLSHTASRADAEVEAPPAHASKAEEIQPMPSLAPLVQRVGAAVVSVSVTGHVAVATNPLLNDPFFRRFFDIPEGGETREQEYHAAGSGVIVDADEGYVLTNNHVVDHADRLTVTLSDGREFNAEVLGTDPEADLAVMRIPAKNLKALPMGDSDSLRVGDYVVAMGNPFGLDQTVTSGIVSAIGRTGLGLEGYENFIQTDASINPGNSGGALIDLRGELVGINTAILGPAGGSVGIGFAIPSNMARSIMEQLIEHGEVRRGQLGVLVQDLSTDVAEAMNLDVRSGAIVARVEPGSAAERAGLKVGDVIVGVDGKPVRGAADLRSKIGLKEIGSEIRVEALRDGKAMTFTARLAPREVERLSGEKVDSRLAGVELGVTRESEAGAGVEVLRVDTDSRAYEAGLRRGDVITSVDRRDVSSLEEFREIVKGSQGPLLLGIIRDRAALFLVIR